MRNDPAVQARMDAAISELERVDGVRSWPGASELEIARAERDVGIAFSADFRAMLRRTNGLELGYGRERLFGVGDDVPVDLVWFNHPDTWRWAWDDRPDIDDLVWVGMADVPEAPSVYRRSELATSRSMAHVLGGVISAPGLLTSSQVLIEALEGPWKKMAANPFADPELSQYVQKFGHVPMEKAVMPGPAHFFPPFDQRLAHEGAMLVDTGWAMAGYADLDRSSDDILAGGDQANVKITGVETWQDRAGRTRIRWVTEPTRGHAAGDVGSAPGSP